MHYTRRGFTLVELIVVIVILGILATIGFVSYNGYLGGARDGNRITQLKNINDSLTLYGSNKTLPLPDDYVTVTANGTTVGYQGYAGKNVLELINYTSGGQDPKDNEYYTFYLSADRSDVQLLGFLEETDNLQANLNPLIPQANAADYSLRNPKTYGKKLGVLVSNVAATLNTPAQDIATSDIDIATSTSYTAYLSDLDTVESSAAGDLVASLPNGSCNRIKQTGGSNGNGTYKINPDGSGNIEVYCDMENGGGGWTHIGSKIDGGNNTRGDLGAVATKPGVAANVTISQDSFRENLTEAMACSNSNCWAWELDAGFKTCLENGCDTQLGQVNIERVSGTTGFQNVVAGGFWYNGTTPVQMFDVHNGTGPSSNGIGASGGRRNMDGAGGWNSTWSPGDQWDIYVR